MPDLPRKQPSQERARRTVDAILFAAAHILKTEGFDRTTTNRIARVAGVSIGSLYQYFPNKESIVKALRQRHDGWFAECIEAEFERVRTLPLRAGARSMVSLLIALHLADPDFHNALAEVTPPHPRGTKSAADYLRDYVERHRSDVRAVDPELAASVLTCALESTIHGMTVSAPHRLRDPRFAEEVSELIARYLEA